MTGLDPAQLAQTGAATLVAVAATDAWKWVASRLAQMWGRGDAERERVVSEDLALLRVHVNEAMAGQDADRLQVLESEWRGQLKIVLREDADLAQRFAALLGSIQGQTSELPGARVWQHAVADRGGRISQVVRDVNNSRRR